MPKIGAEPIRKAALINATIGAVGRAGSLDVTMAEIARSAGMSPALAHHYFGSKDKLFLAAMRHVLSQYSAAVRASLSGHPVGAARAAAVVQASFAPDSFDHDTVAAWLNFYVLALTEPQAARLLTVYRRRLRSNLLFALRPVAGDAADGIVDTAGALIDGVYLRAVLAPGEPDPAAAALTVTTYLRKVLP